MVSTKTIDQTVFILPKEHTPALTNQKQTTYSASKTTLIPAAIRTLQQPPLKKGAPIPTNHHQIPHAHFAKSTQATHQKAHKIYTPTPPKQTIDNIKTKSKQLIRKFEQLLTLIDQKTYDGTKNLLTRISHAANTLNTHSQLFLSEVQAITSAYSLILSKAIQAKSHKIYTLYKKATSQETIDTTRIKFEQLLTAIDQKTCTTIENNLTRINELAASTLTILKNIPKQTFKFAAITIKTTIFTIQEIFDAVILVGDLIGIYFSAKITHEHGLPQIDNNCFINAVIQAISKSPYLM